MKSQVVSFVLAFTMISAPTAFAAEKAKDSSGTARGPTPAQQSLYNVTDIDAQDYLTPFADNQTPIYGKANEIKEGQASEVKKIDRGIQAGRVVVVEGGKDSGKTAAVQAWLRQQISEENRINLLQLNYSAVVRGKHSLEHENVLEAIAEHINRLNNDNPSQKTVLYVKRLGDLSKKDAVNLLESVTRQGTPALIEAEHVSLDAITREKPDLGSLIETIGVKELAKDDLRSALRSYETELKQQYQQKNNFEVKTADDFVDRIVRIVTDFMPDNQIKNGRELIYDVFYEYYTERYLNRGLIADLRNQLITVESEVSYNQSRNKDFPKERQKLESKKADLQKKIDDAKVAFMDVDQQIEKKQKEFNAAIGSLTSTKKFEAQPKPRFGFLFNLWAKSPNQNTNDQQTVKSNEITVGDLEANAKKLGTELKALQEKKAKSGNGEAAPQIVDDAIINLKASEKTGLPPEVFGADMEELLAHIEDQIETYGQDDAKKRAATVMRQVFRGFMRSGIAIVVAPGEPGTGKTSTGEQLAKKARWGYMYNQMDRYSDEIKSTMIDGSSFGYKDADRMDETMFGRMIKLPKYRIVLFDEWEKAFRTIAQKFVTVWDKGVLDWNGKETSLAGTIFWITTNQGQDFFEKVEGARSLMDYIAKEEAAAKDHSQAQIEMPEELRNKLGLKPEKENLQMLKEALDHMLSELQMTRQDLTELVNAEGDVRSMKESRAFGKYLHSIDPVRWPNEILSRIIVIPFRPHTQESRDLTMQKFVRNLRKEMKDDVKVDVYVDEEAAKAIDDQFDRTTGARPLEINLRNYFADVVFNILPTIDRTKQAVRIQFQNGRFVAVAVDKDLMFNAIWGESGALAQIKGAAGETDLGNDERKLESGILTRAVRASIREAK